MREAELKSIEATLKPCPFCGSTDICINSPGVWIDCNCCGAEGPTPSNLWKTIHEAVEAWNRRSGD